MDSRDCLWIDIILNISLQYRADICGFFLENSLNQEQRKFLSIYLKRFSSIACNMINCGPILTWMEVRLILPELITGMPGCPFP